jgi:hypothetical protein
MTQSSQKEFDLSYLLHPARAFRRPRDVVEDEDLTVQEKRAILASWASDACAVEDAPALRRPANLPPISFDEVMDALKRLDGAEVEKPSYAKLMTRAQRLKSIFQPNAASPPTGNSILLGHSPNRRARRSQHGPRGHDGDQSPSA